MKTKYSSLFSLLAVMGHLFCQWPFERFVY